MPPTRPVDTTERTSPHRFNTDWLDCAGLVTAEADAGAGALTITSTAAGAGAELGSVMSGFAAAASGFTVTSGGSTGAVEADCPSGFATVTDTGLMAGRTTGPGGRTMGGLLTGALTFGACATSFATDGPALGTEELVA